MSEENRTNAPEEELTQEDINSLKKIRMDKLEELKAKGKNPFEITKYDVTASCAEAKAQYEKLEAEVKEQAGEDEEKLKELLEANRITVSVAGRVMSRRLMGKASFFDLRDKSDKVQVYLRMNEIGKEEFDDYKKGHAGQSAFQADDPAGAGRNGPLKRSAGKETADLDVWQVLCRRPN